VLVPGRINPRTVHTELLGLWGKQIPRNQVKICAKETALRLYGDILRTATEKSPNKKKGKGISQDIIDAVLIGTLAVSRIKHGRQCGQAIEETFLEKTKRKRGKRASWTKESVGKSVLIKQ